MNEAIDNTSSALVVPDQKDLAVMMRSAGGLDPILERIEKEAKSYVVDVSNAKGRKAVASLAYRIAQSKSALDAAGKQLNEEARKQIGVVDAERRKMRDRLDALKDEIRAPLTAWETAEAERVARHKARVEMITSATVEEETSEAYHALISRIEGMQIDDSWEEFLSDAAKAKDSTLSRLRSGLAAAEQREAQEAELTRLRAEAAAREEEDRQRREAEEAERARIAAEKAEEERQARIEREKQEAAERAAREAEERAKAEAERVQREAAEREARIKREAEEAEARHAAQLAEAKRREEAAAQAERDRIAAEAAAAESARQKRAADEAHRSKIAKEIADALRAMSGRATPEAIAEALIAGEIPHCEVQL